jgi:cytosine/adenosine deaminase-related metal-dependent hydrolase
VTSKEGDRSKIAWMPDMLYVGGRFERGLALVCDAAGGIIKVAPADELTDEKKVRLANRAMLPGMINAHSLRGQAPFLTTRLPETVSGRGVK